MSHVAGGERTDPGVTPLLEDLKPAKEHKKINAIRGPLREHGDLEAK